MKKTDHEFVLDEATGTCLFCDKPFGEHPVPSPPPKSAFVDYHEERRRAEKAIAKRVDDRWAVQ